MSVLLPTIPPSTGFGLEPNWAVQGVWNPCQLLPGGGWGEEEPGGVPHAADTPSASKMFRTYLHCIFFNASGCSRTGISTSSAHLSCILHSSASPAQLPGAWGSGTTRLCPSTPSSLTGGPNMATTYLTTWQGGKYYY